MRFVVVAQPAELEAALAGSTRKVHWPSRDGSKPLCSSLQEGHKGVGIRRVAHVSCELCARILEAERLWKRRGICISPALGGRKKIENAA